MNTKFPSCKADFGLEASQSKAKLVKSFISQIGVIRGSAQSVFVESVVAFATAIINFT
jgi:hypothetical protein